MLNNDPVEVSNEALIKHPVKFLQEVTDSISGFTGKVTGITYKRNNRTLVHVTRPSGKTNKGGETWLFELGDIVSEQAILYTRPTLPVSLLAEYRDTVTGFEGRAVSVTYSANKCVQVQLATGDDSNTPVQEFVDIQNLEAITPEAIQPTMTSDSNPGAARVGREAY